MEGDVFQESGWDCFCSRHSIVNPQGPISRPTLFSSLLQLRKQSSSLGWNMVLALGLCQVRVLLAVPDGRDQNNRGLPVLVLGYQTCPCQWASETRHKPWLVQQPLFRPSGSGSSYTPVLQSIMVRLKLLMIAAMICKHFT